MDSKKDSRTDTDTTTTATVTSNGSTSDNGALMATTRTNWRSVYIIVAIFFVEALKLMMISINAWPYLNKLDSETRQGFFGIAKTASSLGLILGSLVAGWIANRISDTKPAMLFGICFSILNSLAYANIEVLGVGLRKWAYLLAELIIGICAGSTMTWRAYLSMSTATEDRQRAFGLIYIAGNSALIISPFIVVPFGKLFSNSGVHLPWGSSLSIFTAPVYVCALLSTLGAIVVCLFYDGRIQQQTEKPAAAAEENRRWTRSDSLAELTKNGAMQTQETVITTIEPLAKKSLPTSFSLESSLDVPTEEPKPDWLAIGCCFVLRFCFSTYYVYLFTLSSAFSMAMFGWSGAEAVTYSSISQSLLGTMGFLIAIGFSTRFLYRFGPERFFVLFSIFCALLFFLLTFQWPFISARMPNCDSVKYPWCEHTPAINVYLYNIALVGCMGLVQTIFFQNIDVLYSRLLGNMKQGTLQAAFNAIGEATLLIGSPLINLAFQNYGPMPIWTTYIGLMTASGILWIFNYRRLLLPDGEDNKRVKLET